MNVNVKNFNHTPSDCRKTIQAVMGSLSAQHQKAVSAINSPMIRSLEDIQKSSDVLKIELVSKDVIQLIALVKMYRDTSIPNTVKALEGYLTKEFFTDEDKQILEHFEAVDLIFKEAIDCLHLLSTPEGNAELSLKNSRT